MKNMTKVERDVFVFLCKFLEKNVFLRHPVTITTREIFQEFFY